jgi:2'-5' RNA ligase
VDLRCFVSLSLPEKIKDNIVTLTEGLRESGADIRWTRSTNLHITLKFLGQVPELGIAGISGALGKVLDQKKSFIIKFSGLGVFPDIRRPRVVWVGIEKPRRLLALQQEVADSLVPLGFSLEDRPFRAHLTLGRLRSRVGLGKFLKELASMEETFFGEFRVSALKLMKSELAPSGAVHTELSVHGLGG